MNYCIKVCIDQLLWILSWGWYQLFFGILFSWIAYIFLGRLKIVHSLLLSCASYAFSLGTYFFFVAGVLIAYCQVDYVPEFYLYVYSPLYASLLLAILYSLLQLFFFAIVNCWLRIAVLYLFGLSFLCNLLAALAASSCIKIIF